MTSWQSRFSVCMWRGSTTGQSSSGQNLESLMKSGRVLLAINQKNCDYSNIKISRIVQVDSSQIKFAEKMLREQGIFGDLIDSGEFANYKYFPDVDGNVRAWGSIQKFLSGCLVFRPYPSKRKIFSDLFLHPYECFVPVKKDFSDLSEKIIWAENNREEAALLLIKVL